MFMFFSLFHISAVFHKKKKKFLKSLFGQQALTPSLEAEGEYVGTPADDRGLGRVLVTMSPPSSSPQGTHKVVS